MDSEDTNHRCTIQIDVKRVTGVPISRSSWPNRKSREYYISVVIDNEIRESRRVRVKRDIGSFELDESWVLSAHTSSSIILQLHAKHVLHFQCVGEYRGTLAQFIGNADQNESAITKPLVNGTESSSFEITFAIKAQVDGPELVKDPVRRANEGMQQLEHIGSNVVEVKQKIDPWIPILDQVESFVKCVDKIAEVHPYAKMAWSVLSLAYKVYASQQERDQNVTDLLGAMNEAYSFMDEAKPLDEILSQKQLLEHLAQQTIDCAYFISSYSKDSSFIKRAGKHAISITADKAIAEYKAKFAEILDAFNRRAILHTELVTFGIAKGVTELGQDLDLMDMPYADGARYQLGKQCLPGTRVDILDKISEWVTDMDDKRRVCILTGAAGVGKSSIAHTLARRFEHIGRLGSSFCFSKDQPNRTPDLLIPTLARDLAGKDPLVKKALVDIIHDEPSLRKTQDIEDQLQNIFLKAIARLSITGPVFIPIDALDESGNVPARRKFLSVIIRNVNKLPINMKIFFTSRAENDILHLFQRNTDILFLSMDDSATSTDDDILAYIKYRLVDVGDYLDENHHRTLTKKAERLFQWASVACNMIIGDGKAGDNPLLRYNKLLSSIGPSASPLDTLYKAVLSQVLNTENDDTMRLFTEVMGLVLAAYEPLSIATLEELWKHLETKIVCVSRPDGIRSILKYMGSLLSSIHTEYEGVRPLHTSFREYLTDSTRSGKFYIDIPKSHSRLFVACLGVLNAGLRFNICQLESSYLRNSQIPNLSDRIQRYIPIHLSYASRLWGNHLSEASEVDLTSSEFVFARHCLESLLHNHLLYWFEVLSLTKTVNVAHSSLSALKIKEKDTGLAAFATDAQKFIRMFGGLISESCPHIYLSTLCCAPSKSLVCERYHPLLSKFASVVDEAIQGWPQLQNVIENRSVVNSVAFSPDGKRVVSDSNNFTIRIWDAETGAAEGKPFKGHTRGVRSVVFSPDGNHIVSGSYDRTIRIWDADTCLAIGLLEGHTESISSVAISPDGKRIISGSDDKTIRIWDADTCLAIGSPLEGHTESVWSVAFSPDTEGKRIVSGSVDKTIRIWDTDTRLAIGSPLEGHTSSVWSAAFSPNGKLIVSGSFDNTIRIWDADTGLKIGLPFRGHTNSIWSVAFSPDGRRIVSGSQDSTIRIWDVDTGLEIGLPFRGHTSSVWSVAFSPDGKRIASGSPDYTVRIWDADAGSAVGSPLESRLDSVWSVAFSPDGKRIVSGSADNTVRIWDADTGLTITSLEGHTSRIFSVAFSLDGKLVVSGSGDKTIRIWDADKCLALGSPFEGHTSSVWSVAFSPDRKRIISGSYDNTIRIWDAETGLVIGSPLEGHTNKVWSVAFSPDGKCFVSGSADSTIRIWDADTYSTLAIGSLPKSRVRSIWSVAFSPDGKRIISGMEDGTIRYWDAKTGAAEGIPLKGHTSEVRSVAFSSDGKRIVSGSYDRTIRIWDAETGAAEGIPLKGHTGGVQSVTFSPDGKRIVSGSHDHTIRIWDADTGVVPESIAFSPDGNRTYSDLDDNTLCISHNEGGESQVGEGDPSTYFPNRGSSGPHNTASLPTNEILNKPRSDFVHQNVTNSTPSAAPQHSSSPLVLFSSSRQHAFHWCDLLSSMDPTRALGGITYDAESGWILGPAGELIFYVPLYLRTGLIVPKNTAICGVQPVEIDFSRFVHGTKWSDCINRAFS